MDSSKLSKKSSEPLRNNVYSNTVIVTWEAKSILK